MESSPSFSLFLLLRTLFWFKLSWLASCEVPFLLAIWMGFLWLTLLNQWIWFDVELKSSLSSMSKLLAGSSIPDDRTATGWLSFALVFHCFCYRKAVHRIRRLLLLLATFDDVKLAVTVGWKFPLTLFEWSTPNASLATGTLTPRPPPP